MVLRKELHGTQESASHSDIWSRDAVRAFLFFGPLLCVYLAASDIEIKGLLRKPNTRCSTQDFEVCYE